MEKYDNYKDSGIEWIGEIPEHWEVKKIKHSIDLIMGQSPSSDDCNSLRNGIPFLQGNADFSSINPLPQSWCVKPTKIAPINSILLSVRAPIGAVNIADNNYCIGRGLCALISETPKFLYYNSICLHNELNSLGTGSTFKAISTEQILNTFTVNPTPEEQKAIANYLDRKTAELDELIADKKRLLELYEEEKTAIINQAVTKGINPNVPMKDSGIEWLGEIPEHWEVKRLSWCFEIIGSGTTPKAGSEEYYSNGEFNWLLTGDLTDGDILETSKKVTQKALDDHTSLKKYPVNSIVMAMYGATIGKLGILKIPTTVNQACCVMGNPIHLHYQFAFFLLLAARKEIINMSYGGGQPNISQELIKSFRVQVPPIEEQQSIVQHIENKCALINVKTENTKKLIDLLTEYRTALISEVVTGKIKVTE